MIAFVPLTEKALPQVLAWRTDPDITRYMRTDIDADIAAQQAWYERISNDASCEYWLIQRDGRNLGLAYLTEIDTVSGHCSCGFYIGEKDAQRFGGVILPGIVNHVFGDLNFRKIHGEVLAGNKNVLKMHNMLGYRHIGVLKEHVFKYGKHHDLFLFELMREGWLERQDFYGSYKIPVLGPDGGVA